MALTMVPLALTPLSRYAANVRDVGWDEYCREYARVEEEAAQMTSEALRNIRNMRAFAAERFEHECYRRKLEENLHLQQKVALSVWLKRL